MITSARPGSQPGRAQLGPDVGDDRRAGRPGTRRPRARSSHGAATRARCLTSARPSRPARGTARGWTRCTTSPTETANPRRSSAVSSASPSTYRQENVTMCGSRSTRVTQHLDVGNGGRHRQPDPVDQRRQAGPPRPAAAATAARSDGRRRHDRGRRSARPGTRPTSRSSAGYGDAQRTPVRITSTPTPAGPPQLRASPASTDQPAGSRRVAERLRRVDDERHLGEPGPRLRVTGCVVPTSWLAACRAAPRQPDAVGRRRELVGVDPAVARRRRSIRPVRRARHGDSAACRTAECSTAVCTNVARAPVARSSAEDGGVQRLRAVRPGS